MYELSCPACSTATKYDFNDYLLVCPVCSITFSVDLKTGHKSQFGEHYIIPSTANISEIKSLINEWLSRIHHRPTQTNKEYFITDIKSVSIPFWIASIENHTVWKGLLHRAPRTTLGKKPGYDYIIEQNKFRRSYRWAISARQNICEFWGMTRLHEPKEDIQVNWDGFPLDSTFSRGRITETKPGEKNAYDDREFFDYKYGNGHPVLSIQVSENEALRRSESHIKSYHEKLAKLQVDYLVDVRHEIEVAGMQLIHLPFWSANFVYRPANNTLRHFVKGDTKQVLIEGHKNGILVGELALKRHEKIWFNTALCAFASFVFFSLGFLWHQAFIFVAIFALVVAVISALNALKAKEKELQEIEFKTGENDAVPSEKAV